MTIHVIGGRNRTVTHSIGAIRQNLRMNKLPFLLAARSSKCPSPLPAAERTKGSRVLANSVNHFAIELFLLIPFNGTLSLVGHLWSSMIPAVTNCLPTEEFIAFNSLLIYASTSCPPPNLPHLPIVRRATNASV
jgi:hypothetical protein